MTIPWPESAKPADSCPVFVAGVSQTGKSILSMLLTSHPSIAIPRRESSFWTGIYKRFGDLKHGGNFGRCLEAALRQRDWDGCALDAESIQRSFGDGPPTYVRLYALLHQQYAQLTGKRRWGAHGQQIEDVAEILLAEFPGARIIHLVRDPRDRYAVVVKNRRGRGQQLWPGQLAVEAARWRRSMMRAHKRGLRYPLRYRVVRYESLVTDPQVVTEGICRFLDEQTLAAESGIPDSWNLRDGNFFARWSTANIGMFAEELSARELWYLQSKLAAQMSAYGYEPASTQLSLTDRLVHYSVEWPVYQARTWFYHVRSAAVLRGFEKGTQA